MDISNIIWAVLIGVIAGFLTSLILPAIGIVAQPWSLIVGFLVFLCLLFSNTRPRGPVL